MLLSEQLLEAGEEVFDVPPTLSVRVRVLATSRSQKTDPDDGLEAAHRPVRVHGAHHRGGVGPISTGIIPGHTGESPAVSTADDYASHNGAAPIDASSGPKKPHRLNPKGDRQLNHAMHIIAISQLFPPWSGARLLRAQGG